MPKDLKGETVKHGETNCLKSNYTARFGGKDIKVISKIENAPELHRVQLFSKHHKSETHISQQACPAQIQVKSYISKQTWIIMNQQV